MSSEINAYFVNIYAMEYSIQIQKVVDWYRQPLLKPTVKDKMRKFSKMKTNEDCIAARVKLIRWLSHPL